MIKLKVTPDGGEPYVVEVKARDVLVWERTGKNRSFGTLMDNVRMDDLYVLAYLVAKREGRTTDSPATFEKTVDVEPHLDEDDAEPDPTSPGASTGE